MVPDGEFCNFYQLSKMMYSNLNCGGQVVITLYIWFFLSSITVAMNDKIAVLS